MASKTNKELKDALASLVGYKTFTELPLVEQSEVQTFVNSALMECYAPIDGRAPSFPSQWVSEVMRGPVTAVLVLTEGSRTVTGHPFNAKYAGSFVKIGDRLFRYGGKDSATPTPADYLVEAWDQPSGAYEAVVFHNVFALPGRLLEVTSEPEALGIGILTPLPDGDLETRLRSEPAWDFEPMPSKASLANSRQRFSPMTFLDSGDPRFYFVDTASTGPEFAIGNKFHVYPMPERTFTVSFKATFLAPAELAADLDRPPMPYDSVDTILLPIAREHLVMSWGGRRFSGNVQLIMEAAKRARAHLKALTRPQRHTPGAFRPRPGW